MGFLDRVLGGNKSKEASKETKTEEVTSTSQTPIHETTASTSHTTSEGGLPSSSYGPPSVDLSSVAPGALPGIISAPATSTKLYDPYEGISAGVGARKHVFKLPTQPEFVFEEQAAVKKRAWSENLQFYTGIGYLSGGVTGVSAGLYTYATTKPDLPTDSLKLKANRILNLAGSRAKPFSNGAAVLGLYFSTLESTIANQTEMYDVPDAFNTIAAGALAGALFRSPRGPRQAAAAALVGAVGGVGMLGLRQIFPVL